jgi:hypothetical protein
METKHIDKTLTVGHLRDFIVARLYCLEKQLVFFKKGVKETVPWRVDDHYNIGRLQSIRDEIKNIKEIADKFLIVLPISDN